MTRWIKAAYLAKARQLQGGLVARGAEGLPFLLSPGLSVSFVPPRLDCPRFATVESAEPFGADDFLVFFEGVCTLDVAQQLVGCYCLARSEDVAGQAAAAVPQTVAGYRVVDKVCGDVGSVDEVIEQPAQSLVRVRRADGSTFLVPFVDAIVTSVDDERGTLLVCLPAGIMDL